MQSVDKALYSGAEQVSQQDRVTGKRKLSTGDRAQQIRDGNQAAEQRLAEYKKQGLKLNEAYSPVAFARIKRIFGRLHAVSHMRDEKWSPTLVESPVWNAFTTGGTYFVVFSKLEHDLKSDDELAAVIGHEMAHTSANHAFAQRAYVAISALAGSKSVNRATNQAAFTLEQETEADEIGILYCALAGFDPHAASRIWERMAQQSGDSGMFWTDHPINSERAAAARDVADKVKAYYSAGTQNPEFASILEDNALFTKQHEQVAAGEGGGLVALLQAAATTYEQKATAEEGEFRQEQRIALLKGLTSATTVLSSGPVGPHTWQIQFRCASGRAYAEAAMDLFIVDAQGQVTQQLVSKIPGGLFPDVETTVEFESPTFDAQGTAPESLRFTFDSVK